MNFKVKLTLLSLLCYVSSFVAMAGVVKGYVKDVNGAPLLGVSVMVKGTTIGTITDDNGAYTLNVPDSYKNSKVLFSYIGYNNVERNMENQLDVKMKEDTHVLGEVVVTTQKKSQTSIEVPISVSALSGNTLMQLGVNQMDEMADYVPGLQVQLQSPNKPSFAIRGVTSDNSESYSQPRISVFHDGISTSRTQASSAEMFDMERVEVVKGPQGTLFGRGAEIGAVHLISNKPVDYLTGELSINYGSYNQRGVSGFINTPIIKGKLANRFALSYDAHDGYIKNLLGGRLNGKNTLALRNSTRLLASENTVLRLILDYQYDNSPGTSFKSKSVAPIGGDTSPFSAAAMERGSELGSKRHLGGATVLLENHINNNWSMSSITGFRAFTSNEKFDADGTYMPLLDAQEKAKGTQFSQELRFNYNNKRNFSGFVGVSYFYENSSQEANVMTNFQYLYPAYAYQAFGAKVKPQLEAMSGSLSSLFPESYKEAIDQMVSSLMDKWFPKSYPVGTVMSNTPDFYGDLKAALSGYGMDLDMILGSMGEQGANISNTLKGASALPLSKSHLENTTNYGTNQAAELFADASYNIFKGLSVTAGIRGSYEHQRTGYSSITELDALFGSLLYKPSAERVYASKDYLSWVGRLSLNYMYKRNNLYLSVSRGRRPGVLAFNNDPEVLSSLSPEIIWSYEAGIKGSILMNHLNYDLSVYYYDWNHFQTLSLLEQEGLVSHVYVSDDAGKAHSFGIEASLNYNPTNWLNIFGNYSYIDGKFNNTDEEGKEQEYAGNTFRLTPKHSFSVGTDFHLQFGSNILAYVRPSYTYKSKVYFEDSNDENLTQSAFGLLNLNLGVKINAKKFYYEINGYAKNLCNTDYLIDAGNAGNQIGYPTFIAGNPRVFGIQLKIGF